MKPYYEDSSCTETTFDGRDRQVMGAGSGIEPDERPLTAVSGRSATAENETGQPSEVAVPREAS